MSKIILVNCMAIRDSGGISALEKMFSEIVSSPYSFLILYNPSEEINFVVKKYIIIKNFDFIAIKSKGLFYRLYYENFYFNKLIAKKNICLVYNFSGTSQFFLNVPQITKMHNLLLYCRKLDQVYFYKKDYIKWIKEVFFKRFVFQRMLKNSNYVEVQSNHVKHYIKDFLNISNDKFFIKSDVELKNNSFEKCKNYDFSKKINFLYIVGPHFDSNHKNFTDFTKAMIKLKEENIDYEINITLSKDKLNSSKLWDKSLNHVTSFLGYISKKEIKAQFKHNTILISTSIIETLGLHVIEAIQNGILFIVPNERYSKEVYGNSISSYELNNINSLVNAFKLISLKDSRFIHNTLKNNQKYLIKNENYKFSNITEIFNKLIQ